MYPWPGAFTFKDEQWIQVSKATIVPDAVGQPGTVLLAGSSGVVVACGEGGLRLDEVTPSGRKRMSGSAWAQGRGIAPGDTLARSSP